MAHATPPTLFHRMILIGFHQTSEEKEQVMVEGNSNIDVSLIRKVVYLVNFHWFSQMEEVYNIHDLIHSVWVLESNEVWSCVVGSIQKDK